MSQAGWYYSEGAHYEYMAVVRSALGAKDGALSGLIQYDTGLEGRNVTTRQSQHSPMSFPMSQNSSLTDV